MASNTASGLIEAPHTQAPHMRAPDARMPGVQTTSGVPAPGRHLLDRRMSGTESSGAARPAAQSPAAQSPAVTHGPTSPATHASPAATPATAPAPVPGLAHAPTAAAQMAEKPTIPAHMLPHRTPVQLLTIARQGLDEAAHTRPEGLRYATAHLAALRAAAAVLAARARPAAHSRRSRVTSAWSLLVLVAPEFSEWASYFALGAGKRAAAEAGIPRVVTPREADDLLRAAEQFVVVVESALGLTYQPILAA
jgi:hypothetical protein